MDLPTSTGPHTSTDTPAEQSNSQLNDVNVAHYLTNTRSNVFAKSTHLKPEQDPMQVSCVGQVCCGRTSGGLSENHQSTENSTCNNELCLEPVMAHFW